MRLCLFLRTANCVALLAFGGCNQHRAPSLGPQEVEMARHALSISDISLMIRSGYNQREIISEIRKRHVAFVPNTSTDTQLRRIGARAELIAALRDKANVLTAEQAVAYANFASRTRSGTTLEDAAKPDPPSNVYSGNDPLADHGSQPKAIKVVRENSQTYEDRVDANERAEASYRAQKQNLETQIARQEGVISRLRTFGNDESALANATQQLDAYRQQLANLSQPSLR